MAKYIGPQPVPQAVMYSQTFTATASQTTFTTRGYQVGFLQVFLNGSFLDPSEYTATNGSDVVLDTGATANDQVIVWVWNPFEAAWFNTLQSNVDANGNNLYGLGNLYIGADSGTYPLEVTDTNGNGIAYKCSTNSVTSFLGAYNSTGIVGTLTNHPFSIWTNNAARVTIDATGQVGIGTASPFADLHVQGAAPEFRMYSSNTTGGLINFIDQGWQSQIQGSAGHLMFMAGGTTERLRIESGGNIVMQSAAQFLGVANTPTNPTYSFTTDTDTGITRPTADTLTFITGGSERLRVDSSGNVGIGTSSPTQAVHVDGGEPFIRVNGTDAAEFGHVLTTGVGAGTEVVKFSYNASTGENRIGGLQSYVFPTFYSGGSERARIDSSGNVLVGKTSLAFGTEGLELRPDRVNITRSSGCPLQLNRLVADGDLITFYQDGTAEGTISVSGTTVSYNGAHLSRWFQVPGVDYANIEGRPEILRGSVLTNLDEMCDWEGEDNEQLNKMEVSSVKGDKNVAGVFQDWDDDDDTYLNDGYCAMTGDFVIRIAKDCTVERGDLLMSAGDGTACPQEGEFADAVRSCTIAKVTSTVVSHTYGDGSYLVPCVLMAC